MGRGGIKEVPGRQGEELRIKEVNREERNSRKRRKDRRGGRSEHQTTNNREKRKGVLFMKKETWRSGPVSAMGGKKKRIARRRAKRGDAEKTRFELAREVVTTL